MRQPLAGPCTSARIGALETPSASCAPGMPSRPTMPTSRPGLPSVRVISETKPSTGSQTWRVACPGSNMTLASTFATFADGEQSHSVGTRQALDQVIFDAGQTTLLLWPLTVRVAPPDCVSTHMAAKWAASRQVAGVAGKSRSYSFLTTA